MFVLPAKTVTPDTYPARQVNSPSVDPVEKHGDTKKSINKKW